jgi:hypothetical protein
MVYTVPDLPPVTGAKDFIPDSSIPHKIDAPRHHDLRGYEYIPANALPDYDFPKFDGSNPKSWVQHAETYFDVYAIYLSKWVKIATMHFIGSADLWLHIVKSQISSMSWDAFTTAVCYRFDKDEHNHLLWHFFHIRQSASVSEYIEQFSDVLH